MPRPTKILNTLAILPRVTATEVRAFCEYYASLPLSELDSDLKKAKRMFSKQTSEKRVTLAPPAGLRARDAIPLIVAFAKEKSGDALRLSKEQRGSLSALAEALDSKFGAGYTENLIDEMNRMPNGSFSMHYPR